MKGLLPEEGAGQKHQQEMLRHPAIGSPSPQVSGEDIVLGECRETLLYLSGVSYCHNAERGLGGCTRPLTLSDCLLVPSVEQTSKEQPPQGVG